MSGTGRVFFWSKNCCKSRKWDIIWPFFVDLRHAGHIIGFEFGGFVKGGKMQSFAVPIPVGFVWCSDALIMLTIY